MALAFVFGSGPDNWIFLLRDNISNIIKNDWTVISPGQNFFPTSFTRLISYNFY